MKEAVYVIKSSNRIKIGFSKNPWKRYRQLCTGCPEPMALVMTYYCRNAREMEKKLHEAFREKRGFGEWFSVPVTEVILEIWKLETNRKVTHEKNGEPELDPTDPMNAPATEEEMANFFSEMSEIVAEN